MANQPSFYIKILFINCLWSYFSYGQEKLTFSYLVSIATVFDGAPEHRCSGTIIAPRWILTAAHCIPNPELIEYRVYASASARHHNYRHQAYITPDKYVRHPTFDSETRRNDIGLVRLPDELIYTDQIQPIKLYSGNSSLDDEIGILSGWAETELPRVLYTKIMPNTKCKRALRWRWLSDNIDDAHICTFHLHKNVGCISDKGGPLVLLSTQEQIGIASFGLECPKGLPDICTRVSAYTFWIHHVMQTQTDTIEV